MDPDPQRLRAVLEHQAAVLSPIAARLSADAAHPMIAPHDWHGPASAAYAELEHMLRARVAAAEHEVTTALRDTRLALGALHD